MRPQPGPLPCLPGACLHVTAASPSMKAPAHSQTPAGLGLGARSSQMPLVFHGPQSAGPEGTQAFMVIWGHRLPYRLQHCWEKKAY